MFSRHRIHTHPSDPDYEPYEEEFMCDDSGFICANCGSGDLMMNQDDEIVVCCDCDNDRDFEETKKLQIHWLLLVACANDEFWNEAVDSADQLKKLLRDNDIMLLERNQPFCWIVKITTDETASRFEAMTISDFERKFGKC